MSTSLYWMPPPKEREEKNIHSLKWTLAKKLGSYDGSMGEHLGLVGKELIPFLDGIIEGNGSGDMARDAAKLKAGIEKYGHVELVIHE